jgi:hypothetical protein
MRRRVGGLLAAAVALGACGGGGAGGGGGGGGKTATPPVDTRPVVRGDWTYYGVLQGLSPDVRDVSADEGGNVYVAGTDALYVKRRDDERFLRFDAENAGLTASCNSAAEMMNDSPATPFFQCPVIAVAGASPGNAIIGFDGFGQEADGGAWWALETGGADVVAFDAAQKKLARTRHVFVASPPGVICGTSGEEFAATCPGTDPWWSFGRRLVRRITHIVVNHDRSSPLYGDVFMGGNHGTFAALLARTSERGWVDRTAGRGPHFAAAKDVWEHLHPAIVGILGEFLPAENHGLSLDPRDGTPWGSNGIRTAFVGGYGADLSDARWWMGSVLDLWKDSGDPWSGPTNDRVSSMSHCADGTLWIGSYTHGLARIAPDGAISYLAPQGAGGEGVSAVACDPADGSLWIGLAAGGVVRLRDGAFQPVDTTGVPAFAAQPVLSIQIDRWATPRVLYFAFGAAKDGAGATVAGGGVAAYDGP